MRIGILCSAQGLERKRTKTQSICQVFVKSLKRIAPFPAFKRVVIAGDTGAEGTNGDIPLPPDPLRSDEFVPFKLELESLDHQ